MNYQKTEIDIIMLICEKDISGVLMQFSKNHSVDSMKIKIILTKC